jgi:hypothetical protein
MAKQYIPGVSGLLTEPNPVDSPSNTLSDAENVVIAQRGKVQARHGLNIAESDAVDPGKGLPDNPAPAGNNYIPQIEQVNRVFGNSFTENFLDSIYYSSFAENDNFFFKFYEFKDSSERVTSGFLVKQNRNEYTPFQPSGNTYRFLVNTQSTDSNYLYYKLNKDTGKIEKVEKIEYREVSDIFHTKETMYIATEDGIAEANLDDMYRPTDGRFMTVKWPAFPQLTYDIVKSDLYENWFNSGTKCGVRFTFYRETGYTDSPGQIYESQPSKVYEIFNDGQDGILEINLDFNLILNDADLYQQWNEFSTANNGRKFGIFVYRTKTENILNSNNEAKALPTEYWQCYKEIPLDSLFTFVVDPSPYPNNEFLQTGGEFKFPIKPFKQNSIYRNQDSKGYLKVGDRVSYALNSINALDPSKTFINKLIYSSRNVKNSTFALNDGDNIDINDYVSAKADVVERQQWGNEVIYERPHLNAVNTQTYDRTSPYFELQGSTEYSNYFGFIYKNTESLDKYINQMTTRIGINNIYIEGDIGSFFSPTVTFTNITIPLIVRINNVDYQVTFPFSTMSLSNVASTITTQLQAYNVLAYAYESSGLYNIRIAIKDLLNYVPDQTFCVVPNSTANDLKFGSMFPKNPDFYFDFPQNSKLRVEIWEIDESKTIFTINPYLKLEKQLAFGESTFTKAFATETTTAIDDAIFENDLNYSSISNTEYTGLTGNDYLFSYKENSKVAFSKFPSSFITSQKVGTSSFIKVNFNQMVKLESGRKYLVVLTTKGFTDYEQKFGLYGNQLLKVNYNPEVFTWTTGQNPKYSASMTNAYFDMSFNQVNPKYWYKFKAANNITDSNGGAFNSGLGYYLGSTRFLKGEFLERGFIFYENSQNTDRLTAPKTFRPLSMSEIKQSQSIPITFPVANTIQTNCRLKNGQKVRITIPAATFFDSLPTGLAPTASITSVSRTNRICKINLSSPVRITKGQLFAVSGVTVLGQVVDFFNGSNLESLTYGMDGSGVTSIQYRIAANDTFYQDVPLSSVSGTYTPESTEFLEISNVVVTENPGTSVPVSSTFNIVGKTFPQSVTTSKSLTILANEQMTDGRIFVRNINALLSVNNDGLQQSLNELYTDPNQESATNQNLIAPKSNVVIPFKDFYLHAGIQKPLEATISVVDLAKSEQVQLALKNTSSINQKFTISNNTLIDNSTANGELYLDSSIFNKYFKVKSISNGVCETVNSASTTFTQTSLNTTGNTISGSTDITSMNSTVVANITVGMYVSGLGIPDETVVISKPNSTSVRLSTTATSTNTTSTYNFYASLAGLTIPATLSERPYLTLKLTSNDNTVNYVSIQTEPIYNRNGFYDHRYQDNPAKYDLKGLQANDKINQMNLFTNAIVRNGFIAGMHEGDADGKSKSVGYHKRTSDISLTNVSSQIYLNETTKELVITGLDRFNISTFKSPGFMLIEGTPLLSNRPQHYAIVFYRSYVADTTTSNKYVFKDVKVEYLSISDKVVKIDTSNITSFSYSTLNIWNLEASASQNIPLYFYNSNQLSSISIVTTGATPTISETWTSYLNGSQVFPLTFKPHNKRSAIPVAILNIDGNYSFIGSNALPWAAFIDDYASLIVDRFNIQLQSIGLSASLRKSENNAEIIISYPDGKSIEMLNGKYNESANTVTYPGMHKFSPDIGKSNTTEPLFTQLAKRIDSELYFKNEIFKSRRNIPEITTVQSYFSVGKRDKEIVGYAENTNDLFIFKEDGIFRITDEGNVLGTSDVPAVSVTTISTTVVCKASGSIQEINDEIIFLSQYGFMSITNGGMEKISDAIERDILKILETAVKHKIRSFANESKNLYYCSFVTESSEGKSGTYIFNTATRQWSYMNEQIIDGMEDYDGRNLVAYRQRSIQSATPLPAYPGSSHYDPANGNSKISYNYQIDNFSITYPVTEIDKYNNFYYISREKHTDRLSRNEKDQYDFITDNYVSAPFSQTYPSITNILKTSTGFSIRTLQDAYITDDNILGNLGLSTYYKPRYNDLSVYVNSIYGENILIDSFVQFFINRTVKAKIKTNGSTAFYDIKITKTEYINIPYGGFGSSWPAISYTFDLLTPPANWSELSITEVQIMVGVPVKITFNPESGNSPDSNKLFQEFMIHTETVNKAMAMNFKIDGKSSFLDNDRRFEYDPSVTTRNVFRTYIPTKVARGRYLIRQVKHDVPLENLIITGQTIVMRDSGSTRVQKDKDNE